MSRSNKSRFLQTLAQHHASGLSIRDAAKATGCSERTAYSLAASPEFRELVSDIRDQALADAVNVLTTASTEAAKALAKLLTSEDEKIVLAAADKLLSKLQPMQELSELRARITKIEGQAFPRVAQ
jgi:L-lactate utilization protein LutC